ncbi:MAG: GNAT family N-acetyltransferase [Mycoplasmataceae bacterium]|jgi:ribosomal-protein-alanine N-acetyltransferase|nr:GNAT family N-acetyltransferase [Mycoplasmataceae bacterium]
MENIRKIKKKELEIIEFLENKNFDSSYSLKQLEQMFEDKKYLILVYEISEKIVGYIIALTLDEIELFKLFVIQEYRRKKIATKLISFLKETYKKNIILEVKENNIAAINFYKNNGFSIINVRKNYYKGNINALILIKKYES